MAEVEGAPRERMPPSSNLKQEVRRRNRILRVVAPLAIVGMAGTGRKTLAYRFANMDEGVLDQVPVEYYYMPFWEGEFPPQYSNHQYLKFTVQLKIYIIEEPLELPEHRYPPYMEEWDSFCCLVFLFDLKSPTTFCGVMMALDDFRQDAFRIPDFFIVGNKYDQELLQFTPGMDGNQFEAEAEILGAKYFKCSAKRNIGVEPLLIEIKQRAIAKEYWIP